MLIFKNTKNLLYTLKLSLISSKISYKSKGKLDNQKELEFL